MKEFIKWINDEIKEKSLPVLVITVLAQFHAHAALLQQLASCLPLNCMKVFPQFILAIVTSALVAAGTSLLVPKFVISGQIKPDVEMVEDAGSSSEGPEIGTISDEEVLTILEPYALHPDDTSHPRAIEGIYDSEILEMDREGLTWLIERSQAILKAGFGTNEHWFALGRIALLKEDFVTARDALVKAAGAGVPAASAYLADPRITGTAAKQWQLYKQAEIAGFVPAKDWRADLKKRAIERIEEQTADPHDPEKPEDVRGITDANIRALEAKEIDELIEEYIFLASEPEISHRIAYGLGRAAFLHNRQDTALKLLTLAADKGSGPAHALLAYEPFSIALERQIEHLEKAVAAKYAPAQSRLDDLKAIVNLPKPTR